MARLGTVEPGEVQGFADHFLHALVVGTFPVDAAAGRASEEFGVEVACAGREARGDGVFINRVERRVAAQAPGEERDGAAKIEALDDFSEL